MGFAQGSQRGKSVHLSPGSIDHVLTGSGGFSFHTASLKRCNHPVVLISNLISSIRSLESIRFSQCNGTSGRICDQEGSPCATVAKLSLSNLSSTPLGEYAVVWWLLKARSLPNSQEGDYNCRHTETWSPPSTETFGTKLFKNVFQGYRLHPPREPIDDRQYLKVCKSRKGLIKSKWIVLNRLVEVGKALTSYLICFIVLNVWHAMHWPKN